MGAGICSLHFKYWNSNLTFIFILIIQTVAKYLLKHQCMYKYKFYIERIMLQSSIFFLKVQTMYDDGYYWLRAHASFLNRYTFPDSILKSIYHTHWHILTKFISFHQGGQGSQKKAKCTRNLNLYSCNNSILLIEFFL